MDSKTTEEKEEGTSGLAVIDKGVGDVVATEKGVSVGGGTTGIGQEEERKEGIMEEVKLGEEGKELGASAAIDDEAAEGKNRLSKPIRQG